MLLSILSAPHSFFFFFFNDTATTEIYTLSLHDALPISDIWTQVRATLVQRAAGKHIPLFIGADHHAPHPDRKSTRLNSSHVRISYAVFCLKKKKKNEKDPVSSTSCSTKQLLHSDR